MLPYRLDSTAGNAQRVLGTPHFWPDAHYAWNDGATGHWPEFKQPWSMGYYGEAELTFQFALARAFTQDIRSYGMGDRVATVRPTTKLSDIEIFVDPVLLDEQLSAAPPSVWKGRDAVVLKAFKRALARRRVGKPEDDLHDDDDDS